MFLWIDFNIVVVIFLLFSFYLMSDVCLGFFRYDYYYLVFFLGCIIVCFLVCIDYRIIFLDFSLIFLVLFYFDFVMYICWLFIVL